MSCRIEVDRTLCSGNAVCEAIAPALFAVDRAGELTIAEGPADSYATREELDDAVASCPTGALRLLND